MKKYFNPYDYDIIIQEVSGELTVPEFIDRNTMGHKKIERLFRAYVTELPSLVDYATSMKEAKRLIVESIEMAKESYPDNLDFPEPNQRKDYVKLFMNRFESEVDRLTSYDKNEHIIREYLGDDLTLLLRLYSEDNGKIFIKTDTHLYIINGVNFSVSKHAHVDKFDSIKFYALTDEEMQEFMALRLTKRIESLLE